VTASNSSSSSNLSKRRAEQLANFCKSIHIVLLQEVWGPGVETLTTQLSHTHSIPPTLRSTKMPFGGMLTDALNTLAFMWAGTGGLWVAYSKVPEWVGKTGDGGRTDGVFYKGSNQTNAGNAVMAGSQRRRSVTDPGSGVGVGNGRGGLGRSMSPPASTTKPTISTMGSGIGSHIYPPIKRPEPHVSLYPIPLTVPSHKTFSVSASRGTKKGVRALLLDVSEAWGAGKRLLCFDTCLDACK
jgi:hypothetical protein